MLLRGQIPQIDPELFVLLGGGQCVGYNDEFSSTIQKGTQTKMTTVLSRQRVLSLHLESTSTELLQRDEVCNAISDSRGA